MEKIIERLGELKEQARQMYGVNIAFHVRMNGRLTSTAGRAYFESGKLEFSPSLYEQNQQDFLENTVPHEFAHLVAFRLYGDNGHGQGWKAVMRDMGLEPTRCHDYEVPKRTSSVSYKFKCACMTHDFTPQRMAWVRKGKIYKCRTCGEILKEMK